MAYTFHFSLNFNVFEMCIFERWSKISYIYIYTVHTITENFIYTQAPLTHTLYIPATEDVIYAPATENLIYTQISGILTYFDEN